MPGSLEGRVAIITGAGRGIGREHALLFAREGANVVVNDLGSAPDGSGADRSAAEQVVDEIHAAGGTAVANTDSASSWAGAERLVATAVETFGDLHVLVNNAGILRDRTIVNMSEHEWDDVIEVHLKGHFAPLHFAAAHWRQRAKAGDEVKAAVVNTSSGSGLFGNPGQVNYAAAKAGIAAMTIVAARELERFGVRANAIAPVARTRLTEATPGIGDRIQPPEEAGAFDFYDPANVSPLVAFLATADCPISGQVFGVGGGEISHDTGWVVADRFTKDGRWGIDELAIALKDVPTGPPPIPFGKD